MAEEETFVERMSKNTRKAATFGEKWAFLKYALAAGSDDVYIESVHAFYEIFKFLEAAMKDQEGQNLGRMFLDGFGRTKACQEDLDSYLGRNWVVSYQVRESALRYLTHLQRVYLDEPDLLIPHVYHLYNEVLCRGQLLKLKKELDNIFGNNEGVLLGTAFVDFGDTDTKVLRDQLSRRVNAIASNFDEEKKVRLINEGNKVFKYANGVLGSMESVNNTLCYRMVFSMFAITGLAVIYLLLFYYLTF